MSAPEPRLRLRVGFEARVLADPQPRGLHRYAIELLRGLSADPGLELLLFTREPLEPRFLEGIDARVVRVQASRESLWYAWSLPRALRREGIQVFHALADRGLPFLKPCPLVVTVHDTYERNHWRTLFPDARSRLWYWGHEATNRARADVVLTVSETARLEMARIGIAPPGRLRVVPLAAAAGFGPGPYAGDAAVLARHGLAAPYFLYVGGYDPRKNVDFLVRAFSAAGLDGHELVVVARRGPHFERLRRGWDELPGAARMRFLEAELEELPALYRGAVAFINPSVWESFSFQMVEAMASGTALLASNRTALPETGGDAPLYFDPTDPAALAALLGRVASDAALRARLVARGLERARAFSWEATAARTAEVYRELASGAERARA